MQNLGGQIKSIMVFSEVAYLGLIELMLFLNISLATTTRGYVRQPKKNFGVKYVSCVSREG